MGEVGEHGGVPGDAQRRGPARGRARSPRPPPPRCPPGPSPRGPAAAPAPRASSRAPRAGPRTAPTFVSTVPIRPGRDARGLERGDGEERGRGLAVRAGDPDRAQAARRVAVPPARRLGERGPRGARRRAAAGRRRRPGARRAPRRRRRPRPGPRSRGRRRGSPGTAANSDPSPDRARVVGHAPDLDVAQRRGADRQVVATRAADQVGGPEAVDEARRARAARPAPRRRAALDGAASALGRSGSVTRRVPGPPRGPRRAIARPAAYRHGRATCSWAPASATQVAPNDRLCSYRPWVGSPGAGSRRAPGDVDAAQVHLGPALGQRELDRAPAQQVHRARVVVAALGPVRRSGPSTGARRGGTGRGRPARRRPGRPRAPRGRRDGPRPARAATSATNSVGPGEPEAAPLAGGAQEPEEPAQGRRRAPRSRVTSPSRSPRPAGVPAQHGDPVALGAADPLPGRLRDAASTASASPSAGSGSAIRWREGWISSIAWKPGIGERRA